MDQSVRDGQVFVNRTATRTKQGSVGVIWAQRERSPGKEPESVTAEGKSVRGSF